MLAHLALNLIYICMIHLALIYATVIQATMLIVTMVDLIIHYAIRRAFNKI